MCVCQVSVLLMVDTDSKRVDSFIEKRVIDDSHNDIHGAVE